VSMNLVFLLIPTAFLQVDVCIAPGTGFFKDFIVISFRLCSFGGETPP